MLRSDFHYELPEELIAQAPVARGTSRMMVLTPHAGGEGISHASVADFPDYVNPGDVVVVNDTRVFPARLFARPLRGMSRRIEVMLTHQRGTLEWDAMLRPARRVRDGDELLFSDELSATVAERDGATGVLRFRLPEGAQPDRFWEEVEKVGEVPLPPYIQREEASDEDRTSYQTVYATERGAVAAPTAGLHFTEEILERVRERGADIARVTLHVGAGTFRPVDAEHIHDHRMDSEWYEISPATAERIARCRDEGGRVIAIGTTSVRALESSSDGSGIPRAGRSETSIFITPGYRFTAVDALLTNFHLPESTLIMLVSAFAGLETTRRAYAEAIRHRYRFYSYGDCMFITGRRND